MFKWEVKDTIRIFKAVKRNWAKENNIGYSKREYFTVLLKLKIPKLLYYLAKLIFNLKNNIFFFCEYWLKKYNI